MFDLIRERKGIIMRWVKYEEKRKAFVQDFWIMQRTVCAFNYTAAVELLKDAQWTFQLCIDLIRNL